MATQRQWKNIALEADRATIFIHDQVDKGEWQKVDNALRTMFLEGYLFCVGRKKHEEMINGGGLVTQYFGANICEQCSRCIVNTANEGMDWIRTVPYPDHINDWTEWRCKTPDEILEFGKELLTKVVPELNEIEREVLAAIDLKKSFSSICFWDAQHVATIAECFVHFDHPKEGVLFYPCSFSIDQMEEFVKSGQKIKLPGSYKSLYVTMYYEGHNVLLCIEKWLKQVVLYDGWQLRDSEKNKSDALKDTLDNMKEPVEWFLRMLGEMTTSEELKIHVKNPRKKEVTTSTAPWYLLSITNRNNGSNNVTKLVAQMDNYSCGPLSIVHLIKALNPETALFDNQELTKNASKSLLHGFGNKWISWMKECCGPNGLKEEPFLKLFPGSNNVRESKSNKANDGDLKPQARRQENADTGTLERMASNTLPTEATAGTAISEDSKTIGAAAVDCRALRDAAPASAQNDSKKGCPDGAASKTVTDADLNALSKGTNGGNVDSRRNRDDTHPILASERQDVNNKDLPAETNSDSSSDEEEQSSDTNSSSSSDEEEQSPDGGDDGNEHHNDSNNHLGLFRLSKAIGSWYCDLYEYTRLLEYSNAYVQEMSLVDRRDNVLHVVVCHDF